MDQASQRAVEISKQIETISKLDVDEERAKIAAAFKADYQEYE